MLETARFIIEVLVLAVAVGYWAGELKARKRQGLVIATVPKQENEARGQPQCGETAGRIAVLEEERKKYMPRSEADAKFENLWHELHKLHAADAGIGRRIDTMERLDRT